MMNRYGEANIFMRRYAILTLLARSKNLNRNMFQAAVCRKEEVRTHFCNRFLSVNRKMRKTLVHIIYPFSKMACS